MNTHSIQSKRTILILCLALLLIIMSCQLTTSKSEKFSSIKSEKELLTTLDSLFVELNKNDIDNLEYNSSETMVDINEKIRRVIENINSNELLKALELEYGKKNHSFSFVLSSDGKIGVFSWYTRMDNTGNEIKNIALHQKKNKVVPTSLYGEPIIYNGIYQLKSHKGQTVYLIHGQNKDQINPYQRLNSYILRDGDLEAFTSFPNNVSSLSTRLAEQNDLPDFFEIADQGAKINFRNMSNDSTEDYSLRFDGNKFVHNSFED